MKNFVEPIARISANLEILLELDSGGSWLHSPLVRTYREGRYQLTDDQLIQLDQVLTVAVQNVKVNKRYKQTELFG